MKLCTLVACLFALVACREPAPAEGDALLLPEASAPLGPTPIVSGTVLDARSGKPVPGATVKAPGGTQVRCDGAGRFVLKGLPLGTSGDLVGTTETGLEGRNRLRPLEGGLLEVVLYVR